MNNMKSTKKYTFIFGVALLVLTLFIFIPVHKTHAGWISSNIFGGGNFFTDDILGIDPENNSSNNSGNNYNYGNYCSDGCNSSVSNGSYYNENTGNDHCSDGCDYGHTYNGNYGVSNGSYYNENTGNNYPYYTTSGNYTVTNGGYSSGSSGYYYDNGNNYGQLNGTCSAGVTNTQAGGTVTWTASATGGNGFYNYYWTGDEGLSSSGEYAAKVYAYNGAKNATVTITSNGQSITRTCSITVGNGNQILSYVKTNNIPLTASVLLSDVPYTGAGDWIKVASFILALILWSLFITYYILRRKFENQLVSVSVSGNFEKELNNGDKVFSDFSKAIEIEKKEIESVEDYARMNKILLSNEAVIKIIKLSKLGRANATDLVRKMSGNDWVCVGEGEVEKYI